MKKNEAFELTFFFNTLFKKKISSSLLTAHNFMPQHRWDRYSLIILFILYVDLLERNQEINSTKLPTCKNETA